MTEDHVSSIVQAHCAAIRAEFEARFQDHEVRLQIVEIYADGIRVALQLFARQLMAHDVVSRVDMAEYARQFRQKVLEDEADNSAFGSKHNRALICDVVDTILTADGGLGPPPVRFAVIKGGKE